MSLGEFESPPVDHHTCATCYAETQWTHIHCEVCHSNRPSTAQICVQCEGRENEYHQTAEEWRRNNGHKRKRDEAVLLEEADYVRESLRTAIGAATALWPQRLETAALREAVRMGATVVLSAVGRADLAESITTRNTETAEMRMFVTYLDTLDTVVDFVKSAGVYEASRLVTKGAETALRAAGRHDLGDLVDIWMVGQ